MISKNNRYISHEEIKGARQLKYSFVKKRKA